MPEHLRLSQGKDGENKAGAEQNMSSLYQSYIRRILISAQEGEKVKKKRPTPPTPPLPAGFTFQKACLLSANFKSISSSNEI